MGGNLPLVSVSFYVADSAYFATNKYRRRGLWAAVAAKARKAQSRSEWRVSQHPNRFRSKLEECLDMKRYGSLNTVMQIGLVGFTALGFLLTALKLPQYGLVANLISQIFWLYSSYQAWRQADQIGIFVATICITLILTGGIANYWLVG
jgi:hypothetical protein